MNRPDIVAPGGSLDKALVALHYGADAVYVGAPAFSLRKSAANLSMHELRYLCQQAHGMNKRVYLALNIFPHQSDVADISAFLDAISHIPLDACIVSDVGMATLIKAHTDIAIHTSTQASVHHTSAAKMWQDLGAKRIVLARETSIESAKAIKDALGIEIEMFIHGAMCSSFSGKCTISNVVSGRDSNRGGCIQSCRHPYELSNGDTMHVMNAKDLMGVSAIPDFISAGIDAVKIEGRMKSMVYVANACQQYRRAMDDYLESPDTFYANQSTVEARLGDVSNRGFHSGYLSAPASKTGISYDWNGYSSSVAFVGMVRAQVGDKSLIESKQAFSVDDSLTVMEPDGVSTISGPLAVESMNGESLSSVMPNQHVWVHHPIRPFGMLVRS